MGKTVAQYLDEIPDETIKARAIKNMYSERKHDHCKSLEHAIYWAFHWFHTPEGFDYWADFHKLIKNSQK